MPALQSGCYELTWEKCADLPSPMYAASAVLHNEKVYVMPGDAILRYVYTYDIHSNHWDTLPPPGHALGVLQIIDGKLSVIGGIAHITATEATNKVSTFFNNNWRKKYPHMLKKRFRPGVATYSDYVIVAGGYRNINTACDDIELLYYKQSHHWIRTKSKLPEPMAVISLTIADDLLYIAGYVTSDKKRSNKAYKIAVDKITSSIAQPPTSSQTVQWTTIPSTPHYYTAIVPNSCPPVIIGGKMQGAPTADVAMLKQSWSKVASLSSPRIAVAVVPINCDSILVIGGTTGGNTVKEEKANSMTMVEKGTVKRSHTVAAIPTQDTQMHYPVLLTFNYILNFCTILLICYHVIITLLSYNS